MLIHASWEAFRRGGYQPPAEQRPDKMPEKSSHATCFGRAADSRPYGDREHSALVHSRFISDRRIVVGGSVE